MSLRPRLLALAIALATAGPAAAEAPAAAISFPKGFLWGAATAAHQVEGNGLDNDWTAAEQDRPKFVKTGDSAALGVDHYRRFDADFALAQGMGHNAHRLSIEWARIEPAPGKRDWDAVDHYHQVFRALRKRGLEPMVTLHHFTSPRWLAAQGGWHDDRAVAAFERFAAFCGREFGREVDMWITVNEPNVLAFNAYDAGDWPPHHTDREEALRVMAQLAKGHAAAYRALHAADHGDADGDGAPACVGFAHHVALFDPLQPFDPMDVLTASFNEKVFDRAPLLAMTTGKLRFTIPGARGVTGFEPRGASAADFIGVNYYTRYMCDAGATPERGPKPGAPLTGMGWEDYPEGLYRALKLAAEYSRLPDGRKVPIIVTENGVDDREGGSRASYMVRHLRQAARAIEDGVDLRGYIHWTLMDNFEWVEGYAPKFGLYRVDRTPKGNLARIPTDGVPVFREITAANGLTPGLLARYGER
jgi:beta-glucosidase